MVNVFDVNIKIVLRFPPEGFLLTPIDVYSVNQSPTKDGISKNYDRPEEISFASNRSIRIKRN